MAHAAAPSARRVHAGGLHAVIDGGQLRWITVGGVEAVRGILGTVRDPHWGTVLPDFEAYDVDQHADGFDARFVARYERDAIALRMVTTIRATEHEVWCEVTAEALTDFQYARIGLVVAHPASAAGSQIRTESEYGRFDGVVPVQTVLLPVLSTFTSAAVDVAPGVVARFEFEGGLFSIEDQRSWMDGCFKTYSRHGPWPDEHFLAGGDVVRQAVTISFSIDATQSTPSWADSATQAARHAAWPRVGVAAIGAGALVGHPGALEALKNLRLDHLRVVVDVDSHSAHDREQVLNETALATALGACVELELIVDGRTPASAIESVVADVRAGADISAVFVFDRDLRTSPRPQVRRVRDAIATLDDAVVGGGSCTSFADLNASKDTLAGLDLVGFPMCPQVHAFDDATIMESLEAIDPIMQTLHARHGGPVAVGPLTLRLRRDWQCESPNFRIELQGGQRFDHRQSQPLAAAWMLGAIAELSANDVASVTVFEAAGEAGLLAAGGNGVVELFPVYYALHDFRWLTELAGEAHVERRDGITVMTTVGESVTRRLAVNLGPEPRLLEPSGESLPPYGVVRSELPTQPPSSKTRS